MKKINRIVIRVICIIIMGLMTLCFEKSNALAQTELPPSSTETQFFMTPQSQDEIGSTITPSATPELPKLNLAKEFELIADRDNDGIIDPGDTVKYTIILGNPNPEEIDLIIRDSIKQELLLRPTDISKDGIFNGHYIEWQLKLGANLTDSLSYNVIIKDSLEGRIEIPNEVEIFSNNTPIATTMSKFSILVPTPTKVPTSTVTPTIIVTPAITPTEVSQTGATVLAESWQTLVEIGLLAFVAMAIFAWSLYLKHDKVTEDPEITKKRMDIVRDGVMIIFIVCAVLLMGISGTLPSDGVISILSAIVGYVFGRSRS